MRIGFEFHRTRQNQSQFRHIQERLIVVQPQIMIRNGHLVERHAFRVLKEAIRPPDIMQPFHIQYAVLLAHILRQPQSGVPPTLRQEYVGDVSLKISESFRAIYRERGAHHGFLID